MFLFFLIVPHVGSAFIKAPKDAVRENAQTILKKPYVLLISLDGYGWDYSQRFQPPFLTLLKKRAASAEALIPPFPSLTFPSHMSMITGLSPREHGIVWNRFHDPQRPLGKQDYVYKKTESNSDGSWYLGSPLWSILGRQGMVTATFFWPGSEAKIDGFRPSFFAPYSHRIPNRERSKQVLKWLKLPEKKRPHFLTLYFSEVDYIGHQVGNRGVRLKQAVLSIDRELQWLDQELQKLSLPIYTMIVSDHGMTTLDPKKGVYLEEIVDLRGVKAVGGLSHVSLYSKKRARLKKIESVLKKKSDLRLFWRRPSDSPRFGDLIVEAVPPGFVFQRRKKKPPPMGAHGFDPKRLRDMNGIFYLKGPGIRAGVEVPPFKNEWVAPLVLELLGVKPVSRLKEGHEGARDLLKKFQGPEI